PGDQLNRELFLRMYADAIAGNEWGTQYFPLNHMDGIQNLDQTTQLLPFATVKDYENWLARMGKFSKLMDQNIALMRAGIAKKMVQPRAIMERVPPQIATQLVDDPTASPYYAPFKTMPDSIPAAEQTRLRAAASKAISTVIVPAFRRILPQGVSARVPRYGRCARSAGRRGVVSATHPLVHHHRPDRRPDSRARAVRGGT